MALTPEGTPYVESTDLVANYPAASLSLANRVDLVGVLPFATSAARATAIPSPTDGQYSYLQDSNITEFWNGSAWVAAGTAPGLVHINTTTFSAVSSVSIDNVFTSNYDNYQIITTPTINTGNGFINLRLRVAGVDSTTSYVGSLIRFDAASTSVAYSTPITNGLILGVIRTTKSCTIDLNIADPNLATETKFTGTQSDLNQGGSIGGSQTASTAFDGFTLYTSTGTTSGKVRIYGYKNS